MARRTFCMESPKSSAATLRLTIGTVLIPAAGRLVLYWGGNGSDSAAEEPQLGEFQCSACEAAGGECRSTANSGYVDGDTKHPEGM